MQNFLCTQADASDCSLLCCAFLYAHILVFYREAAAWPTVAWVSSTLRVPSPKSPKAAPVLYSGCTTWGAACCTPSGQLGGVRVLGWVSVTQRKEPVGNLRNSVSGTSEEVCILERFIRWQSHLTGMLKWTENQVGTFLLTTSPQLSEDTTYSPIASPWWQMSYFCNSKMWSC